MKRNYTEEELENLQQRLDERGGSKRESVYDLVKRQKKKMRVKSVLDQKANSVADLADVLKLQEERGVETEDSVLALRGKEREKEVREMLELARLAGEGQGALLERQIEALRRSIRDDDVEVNGLPRGYERLTKNKAKEKLRGLEVRVRKMEFAKVAVKMVEREGREVGVEEVLEALSEKGETLMEEKMEEPPIKKKAKKAPKKKEVKEAPIVNEMEEAGLTSEQKESVRRIQRLQPGIEKQRRDILELQRQTAERRASGEDVATAEQWILQKERSLKTEESFLEFVREAQGIIAMQGKDVLQMKIQELEERIQAMTSRLEARWYRREEKGRARRQLGAWNHVLNADDAAAMVAAAEERSGAAAQDRVTAVDGGDTETSSTEKSTPETPPEPPEIDYTALLPSFPHGELDPYTLHKRNPLRHHLLRLNKPVFTTSGVTIKWQNILDAEYAETWPESVQHESMGITRYTAPKVDAGVEGARTVEEWNRRKERTRQRETVQKVRKGVVQELTQRMVNRLKGRPEDFGKKEAKKAELAVGNDGERVVEVQY